MLADLESCIWYLALVLIVISWFYLAGLSASRTRSPLPPGPIGLPVVGTLPFIGPELHKYFTNLARRYGPVVSLHLGTKLGVIISSPDAAKEVLKHHDITFANRDPPAAALLAMYGGLDIAWNQYGREWRMLRKVCVQEMLCTPNLDALYGLRLQECRRTIRYFYEMGLDGSAVNVGEQLFLTVLNVITGMMWGGTMKSDQERNKIGSEFREVVAEITELFGAPNISDFVPSVAWLDLQGVERRMKQCVKKFDRIFDDVIDERIRMEGEANKHDNQRKDFLQVLLKLKDDADAKVPFTISHLRAMLMDMVVGGTETSSNTAEWALAELMSNPGILAKVHEELDQVVGKEQMVQEAHIYKLPYLQAIMKETLRLHSALPLLVPHSPSQSTNVCGYHIPKGSRVFVNVWAIHHDPTIWDNPDEFNPSRFLSKDRSYDFSGSDFMYIPFGSGRRICA